MAVTAPALAVSLRKDPGINGWVNNIYQVGSCGWQNSRITVSSISDRVGPDGAPFGLYLYDAEDVETVANAQLTYWVLGNHSASGSTAITWTSRNGHSSCWQYQGRVGTATKPDGLTYTGYRWTYTCPINPADIAPDGRLYLGNFHVQTNSFQQPSGYCNQLTFWTERSIDIDGENHTFQRRAGTSGAYPQSRAASVHGAPEASDGGGDSQGEAVEAASSEQADEANNPVLTALT